MALIAGVVLAAGASTRMGRPKAILPAGGGTVLSAVVAPLLQAGLARVVVVLGHGADEVRGGAGLPPDPRLQVVVNEAWAEGLSSSLRRGLAACGDAEAVLVALGDQPGVSATVVRRLIDAAVKGAVLALPAHERRAGHPVLFGRALWEELRGLRGDVGGREVVRRHWSEAVVVPGSPTHDLDTEEDYRAFLEGRPAPSAEGFEIPRGVPGPGRL